MEKGVWVVRMGAVSEGFEKLDVYGLRPMYFCYHDLGAPCEVTGVMLGK